MSDKNSKIATPTTYKQAIKSENASKWNTSIKKELKQLADFNTWTRVPVSEAKNVLGCKWVYKLKNDSNNILQYKSRICPKGFQQRRGIDFTDTYAPVTSHTAFRLLLSVAAERNYEIKQLDICNAFPNADLDKEIFMKAPLGMDIEDGYVLKLQKALYGLKQSPHVWNKVFNDFILNELGFSRCIDDPCLYNKDVGTETIYLLLYVDDILLSGKHTKDLNIIRDLITNRFKITDLGDIKKFIGMNIERNRSKKTITIHMEDYVTKMLSKFRMRSKPIYFKPFLSIRCKLP